MTGLDSAGVAVVFLEVGCDFVSLTDFKNEVTLPLLPPLTCTDEFAAIVVCELFAVSIVLLFVATGAALIPLLFVVVVEDWPSCFVAAVRVFFFSGASCSSVSLLEGFARFAIALVAGVGSVVLSHGGA